MSNLVRLGTASEATKSVTGVNAIDSQGQQEGDSCLRSTFSSSPQY